MVEHNEKARLFQDMSDFIAYAHRAARAEGFSTLILGDRYAVITKESSLDETLDVCLPEMFDSALKPPVGAGAGH